MKINTIKYLESLNGYSREVDSAVDAATLYGIGHERYNKDFTPTVEQIERCLAWLDQSDVTIDPFSETLALFGVTGTVEEQHAAKIKVNHGARMLLQQLRRDIAIGG